MFFFIDLDNTIARRNMTYFAQTCNERWDLGLSGERLHKIGYQAFFALPEVQAVRSGISSEERWQEELQEIDQAPAVIERQRVMPSALAGVHTLAQVSSALSYCTVRKDREEIRQATTRWLTAQDFPWTERVLFCRSITNKLVRLASRLARMETPEPMILVDDLYLPLLQALHQLQGGEHLTLPPEQCRNMACLLQEHLTLVAFHAETVPAECYGLRVLPLPSWREIDSLLVSLGLSSVPTPSRT
jgi:hypothetical protein